MKLQVNPASVSGNLQANLTLLLALHFPLWTLFSKVRKLHKYILKAKQVGDDRSENE